jgi:hypothetical protein
VVVFFFGSEFNIGFWFLCAVKNIMGAKIGIATEKNKLESFY